MSLIDENGTDFATENSNANYRILLLANCRKFYTFLFLQYFKLSVFCNLHHQQDLPCSLILFISSMFEFAQAGVSKFTSETNVLVKRLLTLLTSDL